MKPTRRKNPHRIGHLQETVLWILSEATWLHYNEVAKLAAGYGWATAEVSAALLALTRKRLVALRAERDEWRRTPDGTVALRALEQQAARAAQAAQAVQAAQVAS